MITIDSLMNVKNEIIAVGYPELEEYDIGINYSYMNSCFFEYSIVLSNVKSKKSGTIFINKILSDAPLNVMIGGFCHEMSHMSEDIRFGKRKSNYIDNIYRTYSSFRTYRERDTDLDVILRGFGKYLLACEKHLIKLGREHTKESGLTTEEIKTLVYGIKSCIVKPNTL